MFVFAQRLFGPLSLRQILHRPNNAPGRTSSIAGNVCAVVDVGPPSIRLLKTILAGPTRCTAANRPAKPVGGALTVLGVDPVDPPLP